MMLTEALTAVDAPARAVMWSIGNIAERDHVSKQAVSKKISRLAAAGLTIERDGQGRVLAVNVVEYDRLRGRMDDPAKAQAPAKVEAPSPEPDLESYGEAARQTKWLEAERRRLDLQELKGELVRAAKIAEAVDSAGQNIAGICDRLPNAADDIAVAMTRDGAHGVRTALKGIAFRLRTEIADALEAIAAASPKIENDAAPPPEAS
jgi:DNA-binding transcriptional ArsR family regulator